MLFYGVIADGLTYGTELYDYHYSGDYGGENVAYGKCRPDAVEFIVV